MMGVSSIVRSRMNNLLTSFHPFRNMTGAQRVLWIVCIAGSLLLLGLRFINLQADFPFQINNSADLYTDEGWWSNSAIIHYQTGEWLREGDFNPIVYLPVLPLIQAASFSLFGLSLTAARVTIALFAVLACLLAYGFLVRMEGRVTAAVTLFLLSANFVLFAYSRLALLELPMTCLVLVSFYAAVRVRLAQIPYAALVAFCFSLAVLTKTTALFALPSLMVLVWVRRRGGRAGLAACLLTLGGTALLTGLFYLAMMHWHGEDLAWLWRNTTLKPHENAVNLDSLTLKAVYGAVIRVLRNALLLDKILIPVVLILVPPLWLMVRSVRRNPLYVACGVWIAVTLVALIMRGYLPLRYYTPLLFPLTILFACLAIHLFRRMGSSPGKWIPVLLVVGMLVVNSGNILQYLVAPKYSYQSMADDIARRIQASGEPQPLILGSVANTVSLATGIPSLNTDMGIRDLPWKLETYRPDFFVTLGLNEEVVDQIELQYVVEQYAEYDVFDNFRMGMRFYLFRLIEKP
jgi:4-amino-4-deoxy-L-arabinose transferase-like glycosyltransferase